MKNSKISFAETGLFSTLLSDYLSEKENLRPFYHRPPRIESFAEQLTEKGNAFSAEKRKTLVASLHDQYKSISAPPTAQIDQLGESNTFTVTTGHQLNIFTGPLYFIYKIVTVINMAAKLQKEYPQHTFVPVYWMATEDHDFEEISYFQVFGKKYQWDFPDASGGVGRLSPKGLESIINEFGECPVLFRAAYLENETLAAATRQLVHQLFGKYGLLVVDGDDASLKRQFSPVMLSDLQEHLPAQAVRQTNERLEAAGVGSQAFVRDINFFYLHEHLRERIERTEKGSYEVLNTALSFSEEELLAEIKNHPERFSPNVILRPLYQEVVLPNLAYIGGPAEVAYWFQLKGVFEVFETPFPMVFPRNIAMVIPKNLGSKLEKLKVAPSLLFLEEHALKKAFLDLHSQNELALAKEEAEAESLFRQIAVTAKHIDPSLVGFVEAETKKVVKVIQNIEKRLKKAEERNHETGLKQLLNVKGKLFPNGAPQERVDNFLNFYINDQDFIQRLLLEFDPFDFRYNLLEYQA